MRCNEPFGGIVLVSGDLVFHVALLMASIIIIQFPKDEEYNRDFMFFINLFRVGHGVSIIYRIAEWRLQKAGAYFHSFIFTQKLVETVSTFCYFIIAIYALWGLSHYDVSTKMLEDHVQLQKERTWLSVEIYAFVFQIFGAAVFLLVNQVKGQFDFIEHNLDDRYKSDALAYYIREIYWFNLIFVTASIHLIAILYTAGGVNATFEPQKVAYSSLMIVGRLLQFWFFMPLKTPDGRFKKIEKKIWLMFGVIEGIGIIIALTWTSYYSITAATGIIELCVLIGQFVYSTVNVSIQEAQDQADGYTPADAPVDSHGQLKRMLTKTSNFLNYITKPKNEFVLEDSIYSFALYAMIHPEVIDTWPKSGGYATGVKLSQADRESVFQGAVALGIIQVTMLTLVLNEMFGDGWKIVPPDSFFLLAPRFIMAFFMHANLQGEIKAGLRIMKYVVYHPYSFRKFDPNHHDKQDEKQAKEHMKALAINEDNQDSSSDQQEAEKNTDDFQRQADLDDGLYLRVLYAFLIGLTQTSMGFVLEFMSVVYLSSKDTFQLILISYATMACLGNFDSLYSQSLQEHPCREIIGKKICTVWRRSMCFHKQDLIDAIQEEKRRNEDAVLFSAYDSDAVRAEKEAKQEKFKENEELHAAMLGYMEKESPSDHFFFLFLRTITKSLRLFYVSFFFYFAPFYMLLYNYYLEQREQWENRHKQFD